MRSVLAPLHLPSVGLLLVGVLVCAGAFVAAPGDEYDVSVSTYDDAYEFESFSADEQRTLLHVLDPSRANRSTAEQRRRDLSSGLPAEIEAAFPRTFTRELTSVEYHERTNVTQRQLPAALRKDAANWRLDSPWSETYIISYDGDFRCLTTEQDEFDANATVQVFAVSCPTTEDRQQYFYRYDDLSADGQEYLTTLLNSRERTLTRATPPEFNVAAGDGDISDGNGRYMVYQDGIVYEISLENIPNWGASLYYQLVLSLGILLVIVGTAWVLREH